MSIRQTKFPIVTMNLGRGHFPMQKFIDETRKVPTINVIKFVPKGGRSSARRKQRRNIRAFDLPVGKTWNIIDPQITFIDNRQDNLGKETPRHRITEPWLGSVVQPITLVDYGISADKLFTPDGIDAKDRLNEQLLKENLRMYWDISLEEYYRLIGVTSYSEMVENQGEPDLETPKQWISRNRPAKDKYEDDEDDEEHDDKFWLQCGGKPMKY